MDAIIGVVSNYGLEHVKHWVNSIRATDFPGDVVLIDLSYSNFGQLEELEKFCLSNRVIFVRAPLMEKRHICVERFKIIHLFLKEKRTKKYGRVILTDVRDVVFQRSPVAFLKANDDVSLILSSECIRYQHEPWSLQNMRESFGDMIAAMMYEHEIVNAGVICGDASVVADLCMAVYAMSMHANQHPISGGGPDQAALNILIRHGQYDMRICRTDEAWAAQVGTLDDPRKQEFKKFLTDEPCLIDKSTVRNHNGESFVIVHQYDRNPEYLQLLGKRYE